MSFSLCLSNLSEHLLSCTGGTGPVYVLVCVCGCVSFRCDVCRRSFRSRSGLSRHYCDRAKRMSRAARNNCRHECEHCERRFSRPQDLAMPNIVDFAISLSSLLSSCRCLPLLGAAWPDRVAVHSSSSSGCVCVCVCVWVCVCVGGCGWVWVLLCHAHVPVSHIIVAFPSTAHCLTLVL